MKLQNLVFVQDAKNAQLDSNQFMQPAERRQRKPSIVSVTGMPLVSDQIYWAKELLRFIPPGKQWCIVHDETVRGEIRHVWGYQVIYALE